MAISNEIMSQLQERGVIVNLGQLTAEDKRSLDRVVKRGQIKKWRGYWHPVAGAPFGIGPLKTCYGTVEYHDHISAFSAALNLSEHAA